MSNRFQSINIIDLYEKDGTEIKGLRSETEKLIISEHWNQKQFVKLKFNDVEITVLASELKRAIDNAQNAHSF